ncbi:hypothetical protein [Chelativorans alearense]|uniref:hypothetical protein n=1 Tax=Chelativorans alearense TaxID=2681495 RepID=UPI0013D3D309|nr:hypothetical protein [Chelativorans alearense]
MDGTAAIERDRVALKRIVASLVAMAGLAVGPHPEARAEGEPPKTLPRHLWRAILRLLRPTEAAARRLVIAAARGLTVCLPPPRKQRPASPAPLLRSLGIAVMASPADLSAIARRARAEARRAAAPARPRSVSLPLFDPLRLSLSPELAEGGRGRHGPAHAVPRILFPGLIEPSPLPRPPSRDDPVSAARLGQRLAALAAALDDLPGQARRFARWKARRDLGLTRRTAPLRGGRPPGGRLSRFDPSDVRDAAGARGQKAPRNVREVDEILAHAHSLALYALESPDTS